MTIQAKLEWKEKMQFLGQAGDGPSVFIDTSDGRTGPTPMEMVLMGVAGCTAIDVIHIMNRRRSEVTGFQVNITGERAEDHPKRFTRILIEYVLEGTRITSKDVERAIKLSTTKYCSATASLNAQVETTYRILAKEGKGEFPA
jgi:putative redox protein